MINTRIAKLKRNKRVKKVSKVVAIGFLVCPLTLGAINALADTETTEPVTEEIALVEETPATTEEIAPVEETEISESIQPEVIEETQPVIEQPIVTENFQEAETLEVTPLAETVNYTIKCVDENGFAIDGTPDVTKTAKKGDSVTEQAPEVEYFFVLGDTSQTQTIGDNTVFTFMYRRLMATNQFYDVVGDTTAKVGETKTYKYNKVEYWSNGTSIETIVNVEDTSLPLTSSDPSDVIVNGTITFGSEGTRKLSASGAGFDLEVTVTKDTETPAPDTAKLEETILNGDSKLAEGGFTDETAKALEQALQNAKDVLANANSTPAEIDEAQTALDLAIANLVKEDNSNGGDNTDNSNNGGNGTDTTDNSNNQNGNTNQDEDNNNSSNTTSPSNTNSNINKVNNQTATNSNTKDTTNLPETGDTPTNMLIGGLTMLGASLIAILVRRRKKA